MPNPSGNPDSLTAPRFEPGQSGNPGGQPKSRGKLTTAFLNALLADFEANGKQAIEECRQNKPEAYVKVLAALCPKEVEVTRPLDELNATDLLAAVRALEGYLATRPTEERAGETCQ